MNASHGASPYAMEEPDIKNINAATVNYNIIWQRYFVQLDVRFEHRSVVFPNSIRQSTVIVSTVSTDESGKEELVSVYKHTLAFMSAPYHNR